jgi:multidrug transporter EmrE-like cation transporter
VTEKQKYQLALSVLGIFILLVIYKLWATGRLLDLSIDLKVSDWLPDWVTNFLSQGEGQDEFDEKLSERARTMGFGLDADNLDAAVEDDHSKSKEEWGEIATAALAGAIILGFVAYIIAGPAGIAFGIMMGIGAGGIVGLAYVEVKEKLNRQEMRGIILGKLAAMAGEMPSD